MIQRVYTHKVTCDICQVRGRVFNSLSAENPKVPTDGDLGVPYDWFTEFFVPVYDDDVDTNPNHACGYCSVLYLPSFSQRNHAPLVVNNLTILRFKEKVRREKMYGER